MFDKVLTQDEKIVATLCPHKQRFYFHFFAITALWCLWLFVVSFLVMLAFSITGAYCIIPLCYFILAFVWAIPASIAKYKKTSYAITNKRIIACTGICGIEFKSIELNNVLSVNYKQNFWDNLIGNAATFVVCPKNANTNNAINIKLQFINNPDEQYKVLCKIINQFNGE